MEVHIGTAGKRREPTQRKEFPVVKSVDGASEKLYPSRKLDAVRSKMSGPFLRAPIQKANDGVRKTESPIAA
jgi:hypothetical protein